MTAAATSQTFQPENSSQSNPTTKKRIHVSKSDRGFSMVPHDIVLGACRELTGAEFPVFFYVWEHTVAYCKFEAMIPMEDFVERIAYSENTIRAAISDMVENGWLTLRKQGRSNIYGIPEKLLDDAGCLEDIPEDDDLPKPPKSSGNIPSKIEGKKAPLSINRVKKDLNKPSSTNSISGSKEFATLENGGKFSQNKSGKEYKARLSDEDILNLKSKFSYYDEDRVDKLFYYFKEIYKVYRGKIFQILERFKDCIDELCNFVHQCHREAMCIPNYGIQDWGGWLVSRIEKEFSRW